MTVGKEHLWVTNKMENVMGKISAAGSLGVLVLGDGEEWRKFPRFIKSGPSQLRVGQGRVTDCSTTSGFYRSIRMIHAEWWLILPRLTAGEKSNAGRVQGSSVREFCTSAYALSRTFGYIDIYYRHDF
jgi:hypothetical protein